MQNKPEICLSSLKVNNIMLIYPSWTSIPGLFI